ncbi:MAG: hypothetical protein ACJ716_04315 [Marmoricola sp.]
MRRLLLLPLVLLASAVVPGLPAAVAGPVCTVTMPYSVTAAAPVTWVPPTFTGCDTYPVATWKVTRSGKSYGTVTAKNGVSQGSWRYHDSWPTGIYQVTPLFASAVPQNSTSTVVKFGTRISLKGFRQDHLKVPLSGTVSRYVASADGFVRWAHRFVSVSYSNCVGCAWHSLYSDRTDAHGVFSLAAVSDEVRYYRAAIGDTPVWWGRTSTAVHY